MFKYAAAFSDSSCLVLLLVQLSTNNAELSLIFNLNVNTVDCGIWFVWTARKIKTTVTQVHFPKCHFQAAAVRIVLFSVLCKCQQVFS